MNLSGSQYKTTLTLTIPRSNQVVYKGFPSTVPIIAIHSLPARAVLDPNQPYKQDMIQSTPKGAIVKTLHTAD